VEGVVDCVYSGILGVLYVGALIVMRDDGLCVVSHTVSTLCTCNSSLSVV
jgi:hypothetical protein